MIKSKLMGLLKENRIYLILEVLWQWLGLVSVLILITCIARTIAGVFSIVYIGLGLFAVFCRLVSDRLYPIASASAERAASDILKQRLIDKVLAFGTGYKSKAGPEKLTGFFNDDIPRLSAYYSEFLGQFFYGLLAPATLFIVTARYSSTVAGVLFLGALVLPIIVLASFKTKKFSFNPAILLDVVSYIGIALGIGFTVKEFLYQNIDGAQAILFMLIAAEFFLPMRSVSVHLENAKEAVMACDRYFEFLGLKQPEEKSIMLPAGPHDIFIAGLSYASKGNDLLEDFNLYIKPGTAVGILDSTGTKKAALAAILRQQTVAYKGSVKIGGKEVKAINKDSLMKAVTMVSFDSYIFRGTVRENLQFGNRKADDRKMLSALKIMELLEAFAGKGGLDFYLAEGGINLTIGQRRRLLTARALLKNSWIYIFDDIDENIDEESLGIIYRVIGRLSNEMGKTVIVMSKKQDYIDNLKEVRKL